MIDLSSLTFQCYLHLWCMKESLMYILKICIRDFLGIILFNFNNTSSSKI